jgi:maltose O-acetyltransferase
MWSERDKMLAGELYDPIDPELVAARARARDLCQALIATREAEHIAATHCPRAFRSRG